MKIYQERKNFTFVSKGMAADAFDVVKFNGTEAISRPYEFTVTLSSKDPDIDLKGALRNPATLSIARDEERIPIHGVLAAFEQLHEANQRIFYRAVLVPKLWYLSLSCENRLFLDKNVPQIIEEVLKQSGFTTQDYELKITRSYPSWEYVCQYGETDLDFISRWMEREGIYYFFKQTETSEKLVITDSATAHENIPGESTISYSPAAGLLPEDEEIVTGIVCRQNVLPKKVVLKDYNYRKPTLEEKAEADVDPHGRQEVYIYGEHFKDPSQGKELASIRAGEFLCRETMYYGEGTSHRLAPGFLFQLAKHYRGSSNRRFLVTEVEHRGIGTGVLLSGIRQGQAQDPMEPGYSNRFVCIPAEVQFRPERKTLKPRFNGTMNAVVDAAGDGSTAELDDQGRYKVILPFDLSGRKGGKASRWIRMAQPYSGSDYGTHFPLHKGSEVLLTFIDGDLDRPIIASAAPNPHTKSPVTSANQTQSIIRDNYGNEIVMDATPGDEHILIHSPHHKSAIDIGKSVNLRTASDQFRLTAGNDIEAMFGTKLDGVLGANIDMVLGTASSIHAGTKWEVGWEGSHQFKRGYEWNHCEGPKRDLSDDDVSLISEKNSIISARDSLCLIGGAGVIHDPTDSTSIISAEEKKISLAIGNKTQAFEPEVSPELKAALKWVFVLSAVSTAMLTASAGTAALSEINASAGAGLAVCFGELGLAALVTQLKWIHDFEKMLSREEFNPKVVKIDDPAAEIEMCREGAIRINSNGKEKKAVIGVGRKGGEDGKISIEATNLPDDGVSIVSGGSRILVKKSGDVVITGTNVTINPKDALKLKSDIGEICLEAETEISVNQNLTVWK